MPTIWRLLLRSGVRGEERGEERRRALIKSNNPHLAGGEQILCKGSSTIWVLDNNCEQMKKVAGCREDLKVSPSLLPWVWLKSEHRGVSIPLGSGPL